MSCFINSNADSMLSGRSLRLQIKRHRESRVILGSHASFQKRLFLCCFSCISVYNNASDSRSGTLLCKLHHLPVTSDFDTLPCFCLRAMTSFCSACFKWLEWEFFEASPPLQIREHVKDSCGLFPCVLVSWTAAYRRGPSIHRVRRDRWGERHLMSSLLPKWNDFHCGYTSCYLSTGAYGSDSFNRILKF